jgi:hypothetical protein
MAAAAPEQELRAAPNAHFAFNALDTGRNKIMFPQAKIERRRIAWLRTNLWLRSGWRRRPQCHPSFVPYGEAYVRVRVQVMREPPRTSSLVAVIADALHC